MNTLEDQRIQLLNQISLSNPPTTFEEERTINDLKDSYNKIVQDMYNATFGALWDIIEVFPQDIWIEIVKYSLPTRGYAAALLTLTLVSARWRRELLSIPTLWAYIEFYGYLQDTMATIATFVHLSCNAELTLAIELPLRYNTATLDPILTKMTGRIKRIRFPKFHFFPGHSIPGGFGLSESFDAEYGDLASILMAWKGHLSGVTVIDPGDADKIQPTSLLQSILQTSPLAKRLDNWCFHIDHIRVSDGFVLQLEEFMTCIPFEDVIPNLGSKLHKLRFRLSDQHHGVRTKIPTQLSALSNLTKLSFNSNFSANVVDFVTAVGATLLDLELDLPYPGYITLPGILGQATRLHRLVLKLRALSDKDRDYTELDSTSVFSKPNHNIPSLRKLEFTVSADFLTYSTTTKSQLVTLFINLYPHVEDIINRSYDEDPHPYFLDYAIHLPHLRRLCIDLIAKTPSALVDRLKIELGALEMLDLTGPDLLDCIQAPNLQHIRMQVDEDHPFRPLGLNNYVNLWSLHISDCVENKHIIDIPEAFTLALTKLSVNVQDYGIWGHANFPFLTAISLVGEAEVPTATSLCAVLLYHPDACPVLETIEFFGSIPEWDILFIMLETRNFHKITKKIRGLVLPMIPHELRAPLVSILRGIYTNRPSNRDLSFAGTMDLLFDGNM